jgi:CRP-like cAMP-binding protein
MKNGGVLAIGEADPERSQPIYSDARALNPVLSMLRRVTLFAELDDATLSKLASGVAPARRYQKGEYLLRVGDRGNSLLIVTSGVVEIVLERFSDQVSLKTLGEGEYFGELSLFDGQARSASAIAVTNCEIIELERDRVLDCLGASTVTRKLLSELASRVRKTDSTVCDMAERISRGANVSAHAAVSVELDTIKLLYQRTEHRTSQLLQQTERSASEAVERANSTLERANQVTSTVEEQLKAALAVVKKRFVPAMSAIGLIFTVLGIGSVWDVTAKYKEAQAMQKEMKGIVAQMREDDRALRIVRETMIDVRSARDATLLNQPIETPADLRRVALSYELALSELASRFLYAEGDPRRYEKFEPEVVFEAIDTWITLALRDRPDGVLDVDARTRRKMVDALAYVVRGLGQLEGGATSAGSTWLLDGKLRDHAYLLGASADPSTRQVLISELSRIADEGKSERARENAAFILATFGRTTPAAQQLLNKLLGEDGLRSAAAAIALAKLGDKAAYALISQQLKKTVDVAYPFASTLAQSGGSALKNLSAGFSGAAQAGAVVELVRSTISKHRARNCFEERYDHWLLECLDNRCGRGPTDKPIGGECSLSIE